MDVYHQSGNKLSGKILLSSNDRYIILCRDPNNDEINSLPSSSPNGQNTNLIIRTNPGGGIIKQNLEFFQNNNEYKKVC